jgi:virginiamycin B lyase
VDIAGSRSRLLLALATTVLAALCASPAQARLVTVFPLPDALRVPDAIAAGPDGALWFTQYDLDGPGRVPGILGRLTPAGVASPVAIPAGSAPVSLTTGPDETLWYAAEGTSVGSIGRVGAAGVTEVALPHGSVSAEGIVSGPDGALWFTTERRIGRLVPGGAPTFFSVPGARSLDRIIVGPDGALWFSDSEASRLGRITTAGAVRTFRLPIPTGADGLASGDDALWFTSFRGERIGRMTTSGRVRLYRLPDPLDAPDAITPGPDGAMWLTRTFGIGRITTGGEISELRIPERDGDLTFQEEIAPGPGGTLWFTQQTDDLGTSSGATASGSLGRIDALASADELLVARLTGGALRGHRGRLLHVGFDATRRASGSIRLERAGRLVARRTVQARAGANSVVLRLPRRTGSLRLVLRVSAGSQSGSDSATVTIAR